MGAEDGKEELKTRSQTVLGRPGLGGGTKGGLKGCAAGGFKTQISGDGQSGAGLGVGHPCGGGATAPAMEHLVGLRSLAHPFL